MYVICYVIEDITKHEKNLEQTGLQIFVCRYKFIRYIAAKQHS